MGNRLAIPAVSYVVIASLQRENVEPFGIFSEVEVFSGACNFEVALEAGRVRRSRPRVVQHESAVGVGGPGPRQRAPTRALAALARGPPLEPEPLRASQ